MTTVRQPCSIPQSGWMSGDEQVLGTPDRMVLGEGPQLVFRLGEDLRHQLLESLVKLFAAATGLGEQKSPLLDELAQVLLGDGRKLGGMMAVEEDDRGLEQLRQRGDAGIDDLPGQQALPVARDDIHDVSDVVGVVVPVAGRGMDELVDQDRRAPLGEKQERETGRQDLVRLVERALPEPAELVLFVNQFLGAQAIPVVPAEETQARQPAGALQAIEIIELPLLAVTEILTRPGSARPAS